MSGRTGHLPNLLSCPVLLDYVEGETGTSGTERLSRDFPLSRSDIDRSRAYRGKSDVPDTSVTTNRCAAPSSAPAAVPDETPGIVGVS